MSTRSRIGIIYPDGKVKSIYCHFDGYPEYNGKILKESYNTIDRIEKLLMLGNISSLGNCIDKSEAQNPDDEVVCAYCRDEGEDFEDNCPIISNSIEEIPIVDEDYIYLFKDGKWFVQSKSQPHLKILTIRKRN